MTVLPLIAACAGQRDATAGGSRTTAALEPTDSVRLNEPDSALLSRPGWLGVPADGGVTVTERFTARVFQYTPKGKLTRILGRKGDGPGEFRNPYTGAWFEDTTFIFDVGHRRLERFADGGEKPSGSVSVPMNVTDMAVAGGTLWLGGIGPSSNTSLFEYAAKDGSLRRRLPLPASYRAQPLLELMGGPMLAQMGDTLVLGFGVAEWLYLFDTRANALVDSIHLPVRSRRGYPERMRAQATAGDGMALLNGASALAGVVWLPSERMVAVGFEDLTRQHVGFKGKYWISLIKRDGTPVCVDVPVHLETDDAPKWTFHADTLVILSQPIRDSTTVESWLLKYPIRFSTACEPTG